MQESQILEVEDKLKRQLERQLKAVEATRAMIDLLNQATRGMIDLLNHQQHSLGDKKTPKR